jgi:hypothetical protein
MRFMMLVIPKGYEEAEPGTAPEPEAVEKMMEYIAALHRAGVLLATDGLHPPSMGHRVSYAGGTPEVTDGPFAEVKEVVGGYFLIDVASPAEAVEWAKRAPMAEDEIIEVRRVQEMEDFPEDVRAAASGFEQMQQEAEARRDA